MIIGLFVFGCILVILAIFSKEPEAISPIFWIAVFCFTPTFGSYMLHAEDLGTVRAQHHVIKVQQQRIIALKASIREIVPTGKQTNLLLLNADSPIKAMIDQIAVAHTQLAAAETNKAQALVSIARRKAGPFWFVAHIAGTSYAQQPSTEN